MTHYKLGSSHLRTFFTDPAWPTFDYSSLERRILSYYESPRWKRKLPSYEVGAVVVFNDDNGGTRTGKVWKWTPYGYLELRLPHPTGAFYIAPVHPGAVLRLASPLEQLAGQI